MNPRPSAYEAIALTTELLRRLTSKNNPNLNLTENKLKIIRFLYSHFLYYFTMTKGLEENLSSEDFEHDYKSEIDETEESEEEWQESVSESEDPVRMYLNEMGKIPMVSRKEEIALTRAVQYHLKNYRQGMIKIGYVASKIADSYDKKAIPKKDPQEAKEVMGLISQNKRILRDLITFKGDSSRRFKRNRERYAEILGSWKPKTQILEDLFEEMLPYESEFKNIREQINSRTRKGRDTTKLENLEQKAAEKITEELAEFPYDFSSAMENLREHREKYRENKNKLVNANLRLAVSIAKKYTWVGKKKGLSFLDLIQQANIGLMKAIDKYNPEYRVKGKRVKLATYATNWIRQNIQKALYKGDIIIKPVDHTETIRQIKAAKREIENDGLILKQDDEIKEIARRTGNSVKYIKEHLNMEREVISIEKNISPSEVPYDGGDNLKLKHVIENETEDNTISSVMEKLREEKVEQVLQTLPERDKKVLEMRYGLGRYAGFPHTLEETGRELKITRERARQIEVSAKRKLAHPVRARQLKQFLDL